MRAVEVQAGESLPLRRRERDALSAHLEKLRRGEVSYGAMPAQSLAAKPFRVETVFCGFCGGRIAADMFSARIAG